MKPNTHIIYKSCQRGLGLVELMVAMLLSLLLSIAVISVFTANSRAFKQDENVLRMQDDARHALRELAFDLSMAGHYADLLIPGSVTPDNSLTLGTDCGPIAAADWMYQMVTAGTSQSLSVLALDNATAANAAANFSCIDAAEFQAGTDIVAIKRVAGVRTAIPSAGGVYLRTNGTVGLLFQEPITGTPVINVPNPRSDWEYRPSIFYIRNYAEVAGDGIPTLCRKTLGGLAPTMTTECLASGIENLQVEYGIDTSADGNANVFLPNPTLAQMQTVVSARIFIQARTLLEDQRYDNDKTYTISNAPPFVPNDGFRRRIESTTVTIQNIRSLNAMGF
ncbi:MAG: PilW family protein [Woeseiaceae bacterium]|nr:PilW family protein [Woeseiaceae bacterium]